jgi:hypothetical protein
VTFTAYTLNTGECEQGLPSYPPDILATLRKWTTPGKHRLPKPLDGYHVQVPPVPPGRGLWWFVNLGYDIPIAACAVADSEAAERLLWPRMEKMYLGLTDSGPLAGQDWAAPKKPELNWLSLILLGTPDDLVRCPWLGNFNRSLAAAWLGRDR